MKNENLANRLKIYRKNMGLTQQQVADIIGVRRSSYSYYEIGKSRPKLEAMNKLAKLYNTSVDELMSDTDSINSEENDYVTSTEQGIDEKFYNLSDLEKVLVLKFRLMNGKQKAELLDQIDRLDK